VIGMGGEHDYRRDAVEATDDNDDGAGGGSSSSSTSSLPSLPMPRYLCPSVNPSPDSPRALVRKRWWAFRGIETLPITMGRTMIASRANDTCAIFGFAELCDRPLGTADHIAIVSRYSTVVVSGIPRLHRRRVQPGETILSARGCRVRVQEEADIRRGGR